MDIILIILAILIIVAIIAVLFIKKRQAPLDERPTSSPLVETPTPAPAPINQTPVAVDSLTQVETLINGQRYDEATNELKRLLMSNPVNTAAMVKLLQVYGITNNHASFDKLYHKIYETGDSQSIEQADFYRSLLEDDVPTTLPTVKPSTDLDFQSKPVLSSAQSDELAFDDLSFDESENPTTATDTIDEKDAGLDFDGFGLDETSDTSDDADLNSSVSDVNSDDGLDFDDFDFDSPQSKPTPTKDTLGDDISLDFDLGETPYTTDVSLDGEDDSGLDFDDFSLETEPSTVDASSAADTDDGLDFDFDLGSDEQTVNQQDTTQGTTNSTETDLDFGDFNTQIEDKDTSSATDEQSLEFDLSVDEPLLENDSSSLDDSFSLDDDSFSLDNDTVTSLPDSNDELLLDDFNLEEDKSDFSFDDGPSEQISKDITDELTANEAKETNELEDDFSFDLDQSASEDLDFEINETATSQATDEDHIFQNESAEFTLGDDFTSLDSTFKTQTGETSNESSVDNDLSLDDIKDQKSSSDFSSSFTDSDVSTENIPADDLGLDYEFSSLDVQESDIQEDDGTVAKESSSLDVSPKTSLSSELDFVGELDKSQITLDLANQYLSLGEHDSAKRLLEEVAKFGNADQKQTATTLLTRIG